MRTKKKQYYNIKDEPHDAKQNKKKRPRELNDDFDAWGEWDDNEELEICSHYSRSAN